MNRIVVVVVTHDVALRLCPRHEYSFRFTVVATSGSHVGDAADMENGDDLSVE